MARPAIKCDTCGTIAFSRGIVFQGTCTDLALIDNRETCPSCGRMARIIDGVYNFTDEKIEVIGENPEAYAALQALGVLFEKAIKNETPIEQLIPEVEKMPGWFSQN